MIIARYDATLGQSERPHLYNHWNNSYALLTKREVKMAGWEFQLLPHFRFFFHFWSTFRALSR